ncbi:MAG: PAS domain-containing protein [Bacteroidota bacterium]|nr:PAS domain-containing protein [Bacteroidota bacterium]
MSNLFESNTDITDQKATGNALQESKNELEFAIEAAQLGTFDYNPLSGKFSANERLKEWFGLSHKGQIDLHHAINAIAEYDRQRVAEAIQRSTDFSSGGVYDIEYTIVHPVSKKETIVHAKGRAWFNKEKIAYRLNGTLEDVTEQAIAEKKLKESEQRFQAAVMAMKGVLWTNNAKGEMEGEQKGWAALTGQPYHKYQGYGWAAALHPDDAQATIDAWKEAISELRTFHFEHRVKALDGVWRNFSVRAIPILNGDGTLREWVGVHTDITEQKIAEARIRESIERYEHLIVSSPSAIGILRSENLIISTANQAIIDIWGKGWEIMGKSYFEALPELAEQGYRQVFEEVYKTGKPFNAVETPVNILQNGHMQLKYYNFLLYAQRNIYGEIDGIGIIATEVTSQALFNKQIKESEKRFRLLADSMPQLVWTTDPNGNINYFNSSLSDYSGLSMEEINKGGWLQLVHPDDRKLSNTAWTQAILKGKDFLFEHRFRKHTGEYRWQLSRATPQKDENGKIQMWVGTSTDIEEQKTFTTELERQVYERTKELAENNIELAKMNKELQSFAYISSHDLQEPLRKIQTFASLIAEKEFLNLSDSGKEYFNRMQDSAFRMQTLIDDLLAYSRTNSGDRKFENTDLNKIVEEVRMDLSEELKQKEATIETNGICEVNIIPFQFRQLLQNLVSNSLKFSNPARPLRIKIKSKIEKGAEFNNERLSKNNNYCHISISDNGIGFEQQFSDKIFELFQRLHGKQDYKGTGIGLAIVKKIVENHEGIITAKGELNKGATFDIFLPVV